MVAKSKKFKVVGKTPDGEWVVRGMFEFADRFGFPVEMFCIECKNNNFVPDWLYFVSEAKKANWSFKRIIGCIREGASVWGSERADYAVKKVLSAYGEGNKPIAQLKSLSINGENN